MRVTREGQPVFTPESIARLADVLDRVRRGKQGVLTQDERRAHEKDHRVARPQ